MRYRVTIWGRDTAAMADLVRRLDVDLVRSTLRPDPNGGHRVDAVVSEVEARALRLLGYGVDALEDTAVEFAARQAEIDWHPADRPRSGRG